MKKKAFIVPTILLSLTLSGCNIFSFLPNTSSSEKESSSGGSSSIVPHDVESVAIYPGELTLTVGQTALLTAKISPATATDQEVIWSSSNTSKVIITEDGAIEALAVGTSKITAKSHQFATITDTITVTVTEDSGVDSAFKKAPTKYTYYSMDNERYVQNSGDQKVLVIPTKFKNESVDDLQGKRDFIEMSFFGSNDDCGWRSFAGYYKQASFGKLNYSGHVASSWYTATYTKQQVLDDQYASQYIAAAALMWFQTQYPSFDLSSYDANNDGYIDSLYIIYAADYVIKNDETTNLWGYRWSISGSISQTKAYRGSAFSWFSLKFLKDTTTGQTYGGVPENGSNTRIIIHEHGHMLGLDDYYDTSYSGMDLVGSWDMQSNNVFDWNAFSKFSMGWVNPYYIDQDVLQSKGSASITIKPSSLNGDCIVVRDKTWNKSPFDEYLMLELFNPEVGNNEYDYHYNTSSGIKSTGFGVKIYHVDARMVKSSYSGYVVTDTISSANGSVWVACDNTQKDDSYHNYNAPNGWDDYYLIHLLQKQGTNTFEKASKTARSTWMKADLWQTNNTFCLGTHTGYKDYGPDFFANDTTFNDGTTLPYGITFNSVTADSATITFTYLG